MHSVPSAWQRESILTCMCVRMYVYTFICTLFLERIYTDIYVHAYACIYIYMCLVVTLLLQSVLSAWQRESILMFMCMRTYVCMYVCLADWALCSVWITQIICSRMLKCCCMHVHGPAHTCNTTCAYIENAYEHTHMNTYYRAVIYMHCDFSLVGHLPDCARNVPSPIQSFAENTLVFIKSYGHNTRIFKSLEKRMQYIRVYVCALHDYNHVYRLLYVMWSDFQPTCAQPLWACVYVRASGINLHVKRPRFEDTCMWRDLWRYLDVKSSLPSRRQPPWTETCIYT
jgi:hypothetical protein